MFSVLICSRAIAATQLLSRFAAERGISDAIHPVASAGEVLARLADRAADVVVIDTAAALPDPARFTRRVRAVSPRTAVILVGATTPQQTAAAMAAGARGVISAGAETGGLVAAVACGLVALRPRGDEAGIPSQRPATPPKTQVTNRELQVLRAMSEGRSNAEIGSLLYLSEDTVKTHARRLYRKLGARDRAHAVAAGFRTGLVS